ncbi:thyrotropin-releasing hormone receptor-like [Mercenaria mercenaria]|uniref:thyrotropin-releasing hormone receptor-like n=1 Tax=Mercenaria mercenaria TaxID=6596 RepID=UPI00234E759D|nr:thyrotropin-releasing hormone receptor-like [Mercenaria mercenaria]
MTEITEYTEHKIAVILWKLFPPMCLGVGTFGNILTIIILMQRRNRQSSTAIYLTALAVADLLVLWAGLLRQWIKYTFETDLVNLSVIWCKTQVFLVYIGFQCSSWFLVAVTSERFIAVWFPHKARFVCNPKNSCVIIVMITSFIVLLNTHWYYGFSLISHSKNNGTDDFYCENIDDDDYNTFLVKWDWVDLCLTSLIPMTLFLFANCSIIFIMIKRKKSTLNRIAPLNGTASAPGRKMSQMTVTLVIVNIVFIVCSTPISIHIIKQPYTAEVTNQDTAVLELWWAVVNCLAYLNNTLNFVLYFLSGSRFREQVRALFRRDSSTTVTEMS